jgi:hypothetical protein
VLGSSPNSENGIGKPKSDDDEEVFGVFGGSGDSDDEGKAIVADRLRVLSDDLGMEF